MWQRVWIWERKRREGKTYCLRWHDNRGRVRTEYVGSDRKFAERMRAKREAEVNSGMLQGLTPISFEDFVSEELEIMSGRLAKGTLAGIQQAFAQLRRICNPKKLDKVDAATVERFFAQRLREVRPATANKDLRTLKASLNRAGKRGYLRDNPAKDVRPVREPEKLIRALSCDEAAKLLDACESVESRAFIGLALTTGMRLGELTALRWRDVDLGEGLVHVRNTESHLTKSRRNRVLSLLPEARVMLDALPAGARWSS